MKRLFTLASICLSINLAAQISSPSIYANQKEDVHDIDKESE